MFPKEEFLLRAPERYNGRHKSVYLMGGIFLVLLAAGYITYHASGIFLRPPLHLREPADGALIRNHFVNIRGTAEPHTEITINGYQAYSDDLGGFAVELPFATGFQTIDVRARNRAGKEARIVRHIVVE